MRRKKRQMAEPTTPTGANARFSIGGVEFSVAQLAIPGTDIEASVVVGEMALPPSGADHRSRNLVGIGTAVGRVGAGHDVPLDVRFRIESDSQED